MRLVAHPADCPYETALDRNPANYAPLTPISFIERAADVYPQRIAWIHGDMRATYAAFRARARRLAAALAGRGVGPGDTVAVMLPNTPPMLEAHFGVPMAGAVLNSINYPPRAGDHRLHPRARRRQGAADRHRVRADHQGRARAGAARARS